MEADLLKFSAPLLVIVGDEDENCLEGSLFLKRTAPTRGPPGHSALGPHHHQRGAGGGQYSPRRIVRRG
jgi:hypothetical protein